MRKRHYIIMLMCLLGLYNMVFGSFIFIQPEVIVKGADIVVVAQIMAEEGMVNQEEFYDRNGQDVRFTADTRWQIKVFDVLKNMTNRQLTNEQVCVITPGAKGATMHMGTDFELGEIGEYVLLFLTERVDDNNQVYYSLGTPQQIVTLQQVYQGNQEKTLQYNNVKDQSQDNAYYIKCFDEIQKWITKVERKDPIYISECVTGGNYEVEGFIKNNYTYIALKDLEEVFWARVEWDAKTRNISIKNEDTTITLAPNSKKAVVNKVEVIIDMAPIIKDGKSYLPMRIVAKMLGKDMNCEKQGNIYKYDMI